MLSEKAQEVLDVLEEVRLHGDTTKHLENDSQGRKWVPSENIINGWVDNVSDEYIALMTRLQLVLCGNLITDSGQYSNVFYELKRNGYTLWTTEFDSFGPMGSAIKCPNSYWSVSYG